jgi:excisionase family DNA binding protein
MGLTDIERKSLTGGGGEPLLLTVPEACRFSGFSRSEIYRRLATGELEAVKIGRSVRVVTDSLRRAVANLPRATFRTKAGPSQARAQPAPV